MCLIQIVNAYCTSISKLTDYIPTAFKIGEIAIDLTSIDTTYIVDSSESKYRHTIVVTLFTDLTGITSITLTGKRQYYPICKIFKL